MFKALFTISALLISCSYHGWASANSSGWYFAGNSGSARSSSDVKYFDKASATVFGAELGYRFGMLGVELGYLSADFDKKQGHDPLLLGDWTTEMKLSSIFFATRVFLLRFLNIRIGFASNDVDVKFTSSTLSASDPTLIALANMNGGGILYGAGLQIPIYWVDLMADYTSHIVASDMTVNVVSGGIRFKF